MMTAIGLVGSALIVGAYFLNSWGMVASASATYQLMNLAGAILLGTDLYSKRAWSGFVVQVFWFIIGATVLLSVVR